MKKNIFFKRLRLKLTRFLREMNGYKKPYVPKFAVQKSVDANGSSVNAPDLVFAKNKLRGLASMNKDRRSCNYNFITQSCHCGMTIAKLRDGENCHLKV